MKQKEELRIVIKPHEGLYNKWRFQLERRKGFTSYDGRDVVWSPWQTFMDRNYNLHEGYARTKEKALLKARMLASDYCERKNAIQVRADRIKKNTTIEEFKCPGGKK